MPGLTRRVFRVETIHLDLPAVAGAFSQRLHNMGLPVTAERAASFASALALARPLSRRRLYWTARAVFVSDRSQVKGFDAVFAEVFGDRASRAELGRPAPGPHDSAGTGPVRRTSGVRGRDHRGDIRRFALLPRRRRWRRGRGRRGSPRRRGAARAQRRGAPAREAVRRALSARARPPLPADDPPPAGDAAATDAPRREVPPRPRIDLRRTLRGSLRTGGDPIRLRRRAPARGPPAAGAAVRHLGLDGALRARLPPVPDLRHGQRAQRTRRSCSRRG